MPAGSPFTRLCQLASRPPNVDKIDLHTHSTFSDGEFTPEEVVERARRGGLAGVAITDHDTLLGFERAKAAAGSAIEIIAGVEITTEFQGRELHLLGYFVDPQFPPLHDALASLRLARRTRFESMLERVQRAGLSIPEQAVDQIRQGETALGRRHLARLLVDHGHARTLYDAFERFLNAANVGSIPKGRLPVAEAIALVRAAGGVSSWAHPPSGADREQARELQSYGLNALECDYPWARRSHGHKLRALAADLDLAITGGSDCHGPQPNNRAIGVRGVDRRELAKIKERCLAG